MEFKHLKELKTFLKDQPDIHTALIFGSHAKNRVRKGSDLDIAVLFNHHNKVSWDKQTKLATTLDETCHTEVDLLILNQASPHIAFRAIKEGKVIYQQPNRAFWNEFVVKTISMNEDMEILYRKVKHG